MRPANPFAMVESAPQYPPQSQLVDGLTGIVSFVSDIERGRSDPEIFVSVAESGDLASFGFPGGHRRIIGSGAGMTYDEAFWASVGETVERYCLQSVPYEDLLVASWRELKDAGHEAVAPEDWALFDPSQNQGRDFFFPPFGKDTKVAWVRLDSLTRRVETYVPACMVYFMVKPVEGAAVVSPGVSTGAACARSMAEGIFKGICEIVERDAFMIMWRNQLPCPRVEIDQQSGIYPLVREKFIRHGFDYTIIQTTMDLGIPSFCGILRNTRHHPTRIIVGGSCHPDPERAVIKTLLELAQGIQWMNHLGEKTFQAEPGFTNVHTFDERMLLYAYGNHPEAFNFLLEGREVVKLSDIRSVDQGSDRANIRRSVDLLAKKQIELLALDVTSEDVAGTGVSVMRVVAPQCEAMEGDYRAQFLGGKRWRQVPVDTGYRSQPSTLQDINPFPHPYP